MDSIVGDGWVVGRPRLRWTRTSTVTENCNKQNLSLMRRPEVSIEGVDSAFFYAVIAKKPQLLLDEATSTR